MTRKNIFEKLKDHYNPQEEFSVILHLFKENTLRRFSYLADIKDLTIEQAIDNDVLFLWKQRGCCLNTHDIKKRLCILDCNTSILENMILCLEYMSNMIYLANMKLLQPTYTKTKEFVILEENLNILLEHPHYKKIVFDDEEKVILVPKDPAAIAVAEISSDDVAFAIMKYHHASLKGNLNEKRRLLVSIANEYEPLLEKPIDGFYEYIRDAKNMLNNAHIRHNNKEGSDRKELIANMSDEELEHWYDELYQLLLFCVLAKDNKERKEKIHDFLNSINSKPDKNKE